MAQRGQRTSYEQRIEMGGRAAAGENDRQIAAALGCSVWTVRKWRRAFQRLGRSGLVSHIGRPAQGALAASRPTVRTDIERLRRQHPGWGAVPILDHLAHLTPEAVPDLPSRARVAAFLHEQGFVRHYERHGGCTQAATPAATEAHDEWEMDAQGVQTVAGLGAVSVINISDVVSRLKIESYPQPGSHLDWHLYQVALRRAFVQYGLPRRITLDHDSAFYDNTCRSPYPTHLHLWLVALGVAVVFIEQPPPAAHAIIERTHQTMSRQAVKGRREESQAALWYELDERRQVLNERLPCRSLDGQPPLVAYPDAARPRRPYRLEWEEAMLNLTRIHALLATGRWFRQASSHGEFGLGTQHYNVSRANARAMLEIGFDPATIEFVIQIAGTQQIIRRPARGLTKADLMGDCTTIALPNYQFGLPFSRQDWCTMALADCTTGTTL